MTLSGSEICTLRSISLARSRACLGSSPAITNTSVTWSPIRIVGFSAPPGFW